MDIRSKHLSSEERGVMALALCKTMPRPYVRYVLIQMYAFT